MAMTITLASVPVWNRQPEPRSLALVSGDLLLKGKKSCRSRFDLATCELYKKQTSVLPGDNVA